MAPKIRSAMILVRLIPMSDTGYRTADRKELSANQKSFRFPLLSAPLAICRSHLTQKFKFIQTFARSFGHGAERIFRNMDRQTSLLAQKFVEPTQERPPACQNQTAIHQVGR